MSRRRRRSPGCTGSIPARTLFVEQSEEAIAAGAFHNDVVAVANERVLFAHEQAFADRDALDRRAASGWCPSFEIVEVPASRGPPRRRDPSYLFNAQLVTPPDGEMTLIVPERSARDAVGLGAGSSAISPATARSAGVEVVDVRQSMANGGGPACLRLRVVADPATVDPRFLVDEAKLDRIAEVIERHWPEEIADDDLQQPALIARHRGRARCAARQRSTLRELVADS